ncbi:hypothetical protein [Micromonospora zamorensis]|uniref:hypothetical protein n=1 Tax=Micromonospora zamorensis TaxID=709883 RepID=UPI0033A9902F
MLLNSLHFMMLRHDLGKWPGRYRAGDIHTDEAHTGRRVYTGPDADDAQRNSEARAGRAMVVTSSGTPKRSPS